MTQSYKIKLLRRFVPLAGNGQASHNPPEWIAALQPQVLLLSVALNDRRGLPDESLLQGLADYSLLRSDRNGWIELTTDGERLWLEVERK